MRLAKSTSELFISAVKFGQGGDAGDNWKNLTQAILMFLYF